MIFISGCKKTAISTDLFSATRLEKPTSQAQPKKCGTTATLGQRRQPKCTNKGSAWKNTLRKQTPSGTFAAAGQQPRPRIAGVGPTRKTEGQKPCWQTVAFPQAKPGRGSVRNPGNTRPQKEETSKTPLQAIRDGLKRCFWHPLGESNPQLALRSLACPMPYGTDIIYGDSSFVIHFEVQGFCGAICTKCRVLPHFLRRPISKLLAGIALPTTSFHHALSPCH